MKNITDRLDKLNLYKVALKHQRGRHDQRTHNRWPAGYRPEGLPQNVNKVNRKFRVASVLSKRMSSVTDNASKKYTARSVTPFSVESNTLASRRSGTTSTAAPQSIALSGAELARTMQAEEPRPSNLMIAKHLMERGYMVREKLSKNSRTGYWAQGEGYFKDIDKTPINRKLNYDELAAKSAFWQRAYVAALQQYSKDGSALSVEEQYVKAINFADHIEHMTKEGSPYDIGRNMAALGNLQSLLGDTETQQDIQNSSDAFAPLMYQLRRLYSVPLKMWEKYKPGTPLSDDPYFTDMFTTTNYGNQADMIANGFDIVDALSRGKESQLGYVSDLFPELNTFLRDMIITGRTGAEVRKLPSQFVVALSSGSPTDPPSFASSSSYEFEVKPDQVSSSAPKQIENSSDFVFDARIGLPIPASSAQLADAIDPNGLFAETSVAAGSTEVNSASFEEQSAKIREIAAETGLPVNLVSTMLMYWQHGAQTIGNFPIPSLIRLQDAAAELFGLQLGENDERLNSYQQGLLQEADVIARGGRQRGSASNDKYERTKPVNEHFFVDPFERNFEYFTLREIMFPFRGSEQGTTIPEDISTFIMKLREDMTPEERSRVDEWRNSLKPIASSSEENIPGTPYEKSQDARKALLKNIYDRTQQLLEEKGIKKATLYRSIALTKEQLDAVERSIREKTGDQRFTVYNRDGSFNPDSINGQDIDLPRNALESWTYDLPVADSMAANIDGVGKDGLTPIFAEIVMATDVDASRIVSTPATGFGRHTEAEIVITGNKDDTVKVVATHARDKKNKLKKQRFRDLNLDEIEEFLRDRLSVTNSSYWYTNYQRIMSLLFNAERESLASRRAQIIDDALEQQIFFDGMG
jgi:hypothetical protein